jgi:hypothetical protein
MAYSSLTDFLALVRSTAGGARVERMPGMDYVLAALARAGMFTLSVSATEPATDQATTAWLRPAEGGSWTAEGTLFLWNAGTAAYEPATPALWKALIEAA